MNVALVNTNRMQPPIAPIGLDYLAEAMHAAGHAVKVLDLCFEPDPGSAIARFFGRAEFGLVGVTLRNTDDCGFTTRQSFLPSFASIVHSIREVSSAPLVAGGVGFSVMPELALSLCGADFGVWGDGDLALPALAGCLERREDWRALPSLLWRDRDAWRRNPPAFRPLDDLPPMTRRWVDNSRYFREGGQGGFETKRGCSSSCIYCADPVAKGAATRLRPPAAVAAELQNLLDLGIDHLHTCDGEFNLPPAHALEICAEIVRRGLPRRLRWYAYCSAARFSPELAAAMRDAGCAGINFGVDSGDAAMLRRLGRGFSPEDILDAARWCREAGLSTMFDLLLGAPGESRSSLERTVALMKTANPDRVGVSVGVRVYPGTVLARRLAPAADPSEPHFFLEPAVAPFIFPLLDELIAGDERFLFFDPSKPGCNYDYNGNAVLVDAIRQGCRGAYWDILRRCHPSAR